jgi:hypothetical protein
MKFVIYHRSPLPHHNGVIELTTQLDVLKGLQVGTGNRSEND